MWQKMLQTGSGGSGGGTKTVMSCSISTYTIATSGTKITTTDATTGETFRPMILSASLGFSSYTGTLYYNELTSEKRYVLNGIALDFDTYITIEDDGFTAKAYTQQWNTLRSIVANGIKYI